MRKMSRFILNKSWNATCPLIFTTYSFQYRYGKHSMLYYYFRTIIIFLCILLLRDGVIVLYSVACIITGLIAWAIPIIDRVFLKTYHAERSMLVSVGFAFLSVWIQFLDIKNLTYTGNWSAIHDTINILSAVVIIFCIIT